MDGYQLDNCSSLLVAKPACYAKCDTSPKKGRPGSYEPESPYGTVDKCTLRGFDPAAARPHLKDIIYVIKERNLRQPCPILSENLMTGYGGFVPNQQFQIGKTYTESCIRAIGEFETGGRMDERSGVPSSDYIRQQMEQGQAQGPKRSSLLAAVLAQRYEEEKRQKGFISPYHMANDDPLKNYIPGYAGYVPKTMNRFGTYSDMTHTALNEFTDTLLRRRKKAQEAKDPCAS